MNNQTKLDSELEGIMINLKELINRTMDNELSRDIELGKSLLNIDMILEYSKLYDYMENMRLKYICINALYILIKYGPSQGNNRNSKRVYDKNNLKDQIHALESFKKLKDSADGTETTKELRNKFESIMKSNGSLDM